MAKIPKNLNETINSLKQQALEIIEEATATEMAIFEMFGETEVTLPYLGEVNNVTNNAEATYTRLSTLQLRIAKSQPTAAHDMVKLLDETIASTQARIPAWERSIKEVKEEWRLS